MQLTDILSSDSIFLNVECKSKKQLFQHMACAAASKFGLEKSSVFDALSEREKLGSTALGSGVAIPHGRIDGSNECHLFFARLTESLDFEADDEQDADLIFCLLGCHQAKNEPVKIISRVSRLSADSSFRDELRKATSAEEVLSILTGDSLLHAA